eukprot:gene17085-34695_t
MTTVGQENNHLFNELTRKTTQAQSKGRTHIAKMAAHAWDLLAEVELDRGAPRLLMHGIAALVSALLSEPASEPASVKSEAFFRLQYPTMKRRYASFQFGNGMRQRVEAMLTGLSPALEEWADAGSKSDAVTFPPIVYNGWDARPVPPLWQDYDDNYEQGVELEEEDYEQDRGHEQHDIKSKNKKMPGVMKALFVSPVYIVNLYDEGAVLPTFSDNLANYAVRKYEEFLHTDRALNPKTGSLEEAWVLNDLFFDVQDKPPVGLPEHDELMLHVHAACSRYVKEWGLSSTTLSDSFNAELYDPFRTGWFSVHGNQSTTPEDGRIIFEDPRGHVYDEKALDSAPFPIPPFAGNRHYLTPKTGDLIVFPGWLWHSVERVDVRSDYRVSFAFNLDGSWQDAVP